MSTNGAITVDITAAEFFAASPEQIRIWFPDAERVMAGLVKRMCGDITIATSAPAPAPDAEVAA